MPFLDVYLILPDDGLFHEIDLKRTPRLKYTICGQMINEKIRYGGGQPDCSKIVLMNGRKPCLVCYPFMKRHESK